MRDKPKVVVVTGASAGVGRAVVRRFARPGVRIALLARGPDGLEAARSEVEAQGGEALVCPVDVADAAAVEQAAEQIERELGPIDVWVNNAMTSVFARFWEVSAEEFRRVTEVCYLGYVYGTMAALKRMRPRDRGVIVQVGSALAYRSIPLQSAYCGAKHAIVGFTDSIRSELLHERSRVHITVVHLPAMNTPQFGWVKSRLPHKAQPVPPIYQPEVAAEGVHYAARSRRREVWVGFSTTKAILGQKIAPGYADQYLAETGFRSQQTDEPRPPDQPVNLWEPVPGDHGAHGEFDRRARCCDPQIWALENVQALALAAVGLVGFGVGLIARR